MALEEEFAAIVQIAPDEELQPDTMPVSDEITEIEAMDISDLRARWRFIKNNEPPPHLSRRLLQSALVYDLQAKRFGGLSRDAERRLKRISAHLEEAPDAPVLGASAPAPGARLVREWRGERHVVEVLSDGFAYRSSVYGSLSEIARLITNAHWSGPRFFGLKNRRKKA